MDAFLAAVLAEPDDDLPRLMFADYLDERGDPRGEFIRTQIELAGHDHDASSRGVLLAREAELTAKLSEAWLEDFEDKLYRWWFHRGFIEVSLNIQQFLQD